MSALRRQACSTQYILGQWVLYREILSLKKKKQGKLVLPVSLMRVILVPGECRNKMGQLLGSRGISLCGLVHFSRECHAEVVFVKSPINPLQFQNAWCFYCSHLSCSRGPLPPRVGDVKENRFTVTHEP